MISRLIDFALVVLFKVWGITGISKIEFFTFSGTEMVNNYGNRANMRAQSFQVNHSSLVKLSQGKC